VNLVFSIPNLDWEKPIDHLETFAGDAEVTKHEWMDCQGFERKNAGVFSIIVLNERCL